MPAVTDRDFDGLEFMRMLCDWRSVEFQIEHPADWWVGRAAFVERLEPVVQCRYFVSLAREDDLTDTIAYLTAHFEDETMAIIAAETLGGTLRPAIPKTSPGPTPEWLKNFSKSIFGDGDG